MKKLLCGLFILSSVISVANTDLMTKFNALESSYQKLVNQENAQYEKVKNEGTALNLVLDERISLRDDLASKVDQLESMKKSSFYKQNYEGIVKEYKGVIKMLDSEIKKDTKKLNDIQKIIDVKGE